MNIFVTDININKCAQHLDDKRLNKMIVESAQLLSNQLYGSEVQPPYKQTHLNHPANKWVNSSCLHYDFLLRLLNNYLLEWNYRFDKVHKVTSIIKYFYTYDDRMHNFYEVINSIGIIGRSSLLYDGIGIGTYDNASIKLYNGAKASSDDTDTVIRAYRKLLMDKWANDKRPPKWTKRNKPNW